MAAIDPTQTPLNKDQPKRATLKLVRRPLDHDDFEDDDEENEDEDSDEEEAIKKLIAKSDKLSKSDKALKKAQADAKANAMEVDAEDDDEDDEGFETEEFVICTLDDKVCGDYSAAGVNRN
jgi:FK506-binding nuclear protein